MRLGRALGQLGSQRSQSEGYSVLVEGTEKLGLRQLSREDVVILLAARMKSFCLITLLNNV